MNPFIEYMREVAQPMRDELTNAGFTELTTAEEVSEFFANETGTSLVVINSVCGCAAGLARPSAIEAVQGEKRPDNLVTVFAGQDREATVELRSYFPTTPPSSPSMALMKGGELIHFIPREEIEDADKEEIIKNLRDAFAKYC
ncbi:BrxA/BrxB family bacilliredoxin [Aciduricibacillus chroicocephali]|uniref:BrxA/BrxB family bacilliredoxin n=1 Tax=Aciduricibacillus chroicocephali TaxID=3054939 RepID=A0ABY9KV02_9BACI|nr:BrxA/BrxB family bacilliredoxin [Bacillaceae bacterium 44XB]